MPRFLKFDENNVPMEVIQGYPQADDYSNNRLIWVNLRSSDNIRNGLPDLVDKSRSFTEDLIEEQRPRIGIFPTTTEEHEGTFSVIVFSIPTSKIFLEDDFLLQITFILLNNRIYSIGSVETGLFAEIMSKIQAKKDQYDITLLFNFIVGELFESAIEVMSQVEEQIDHIEGKQLTGNLERGWLVSSLSLKSRLFDSNRMCRANLEHIREIMQNEVPEIDGEVIGEHLEDRQLFLVDFIETLREELANIINLNLAITTNILNRQFYWLTIIGALLIIPTVISGIWGMNVPVPQLNFWVILGLIVILTILFGIIVRIILPKPNFG